MNFTVLDALGYSVLGICVVFLMLVLLMIVIYIFGKTMGGKKQQAETHPAAPQPVAAAPAPAAAPAAPKSGRAYDEVKLYNVDDRTAVMIMAITASQVDIPLNQLHFVSIKEI